jgi:hypothetical protein
MPTPTLMYLPKTKSEDEFENICVDILKYSYNISFSRYGRKGQKQHGIDIYCDADNGKRLVAQCKNYLSSKADELNVQIEKDIEAAKEQFDIDTFIIMTAHERDTSVQDFISKLKDKHTFNLELWFWEDIQGKIIESSELLHRYYPSYIIKPDKLEKDMLVTLLSEARGKCLSCGRELGIPVRGKLPSSNYEIKYITFSDSDTNSYENAVALCSDRCVTEFALMSDEEKADLLESKQRCAEIQAFLEKIHGIKFQKEIETVLREIHKIKNDGKLEKVDPKDLVDIEQKIHEPFLKEKINASMVRLYNPVKRICSRLEQEIGFDTQNFGELIKSIQIILTSNVMKNSEISDPQEYVIKLLVENLSSQVGQRHADACEIIIGYLVKRCDLFNENAKQS